MFTIDPASATPPFEQLRSQLLEAARSGALATGAKLPTVRALADELGLAPNTVARAYRELEADGIIETHGRNGSYVSPHGDAAERQAQIAARSYVDRIHQLGVDDDAALALVKSALKS